MLGQYSLGLMAAVLRSRTRAAEDHARLEAEVAARIKSEFIASMSHELRTPLNSVIGFSRMLAEHDKRNFKKEEVVEYAKLIRDSADHLLTLINDILDISKLQSGTFYLDAEEIDLDELLESIVSAQRKTALASEIDLSANIATTLPVIVGDRGKLQQAIANLLSNAVKFTQAGGSVSIAAIGDGEEQVRIIIKDSGVGMDAEEIELAMAPFGQVDGARTRWREGAGLGLPIAKSMIELHGGALAIKSEKGIGSEVVVTLPTKSVVIEKQREERVLARARAEL
ncbi:MAG: HAMP domain-containing sensor histidine kinase [Hyphomicrobiaceae bacterium]